MDDLVGLEVQLRAHKLNLLREREQLSSLIQEYETKRKEIECKINAVNILLPESDAPVVPELTLIPREKPAPQPRRRKGGRETVVEAAAAVLAQENRPMSARELESAIRGRIAELKAKDPVGVVGILLRRSPRFVRVKPGMFALAGSKCETPSG